MKRTRLQPRFRLATEGIRKGKALKESGEKNTNSYTITQKKDVELCFDKVVPVIFLVRKKRKRKQRRPLKKNQRKAPMTRMSPLQTMRQRTRRRKLKLPWFFRATTGATKRGKSLRREKRQWLGLS